MKHYVTIQVNIFFQLQLNLKICSKGATPYTIAATLYRLTDSFINIYTE